MRIARLADARVVLVGDMDRGGMLGGLVGTLALLDPADRARVGGFVVNRFRGDVAVLRPGLEELTARTGVPVLGVVPWIPGRLAPAEDSLDLDSLREPAGGESAAIEIARSEEHTSELQSHFNLVSRLLLEKKKQHTNRRLTIS